MTGESKELSEIKNALPESTPEERQRFLAGQEGNVKAATSKLKSYLEWRNEHCDDKLRNELEDSWEYASRLALKAASSKAKDQATNNDIDSSSDVKLPCILFMAEHEKSTSNANETNNALEKKRYLQHLPARVDPKISDTSTYALALALYLDHKLDRNSTEKITLVIDVRCGDGWANVPALQLLPFIQSTSRLLSDLYPERLEKCVVFPVPVFASWIWKAVGAFLREEVVSKVGLVSGPAGQDDVVPTKVGKYLDEEVIQMLEETRNGLVSEK